MLSGLVHVRSCVLLACIGWRCAEFVYACPDEAPIRQKMVYSTGKTVAVQLIKAAGVSLAERPVRSCCCQLVFGGHLRAGFCALRSRAVHLTRTSARTPLPAAPPTSLQVGVTIEASKLAEMFVEELGTSNAPEETAADEDDLSFSKPTRPGRGKARVTRKKKTPLKL